MGLRDLPRPDHPDFWRLSEIVVALDRTSEEAGDGFDMAAHIGEIIDPDSLVYVATQRVQHLIRSQVAGPIDPELLDLLVVMVSSAWVEAFCVGARYEGGKE